MSLIIKTTRLIQCLLQSERLETVLKQQTVTGSKQKRHYVLTTVDQRWQAAMPENL